MCNQSKDPDEINNLADSSRLDQNSILINRLLNKLYKHIEHNNIGRIYIATPKDIIIDKFANEIKQMITNLTRIYNYTKLTSDFYTSREIMS